MTGTKMLAVAGLVAAAACTFSSAGLGGDGGGEGGDATSGVATGPGPTSDATGMPPSAGSGGATSAGTAGDTDAPATSGASTGAMPPPGETTGGDESTTGAPFDCEGGRSFATIREVADAVAIDPPMTTDPAWGGLPGAPDVAWSDDSAGGAITFEIDVPCDRTYYLWGLTWDKIHGVSNCSGTTNADAYMVSVDGGSEIRWAYGCQGCSNPDSAWTWTIVHEYFASGCDTGLWSVDLTAGTHTVRFRNFESGTFDPPSNPDVAAIAAMAVSDDASFSPMWP